MPVDIDVRPVTTDRILRPERNVRRAEQAVADARVRTGSLTRTTETLSGDGRRLGVVSDPEAPTGGLAGTLAPLADPERPISVEAVTAHVAGPTPARRLSGAVKVGAVAAALLAILLAWRSGPLADYADIERIRALLSGLGGAWTPLAVAGIYTAASLVGFPVTMLIAATAMVFGGWLGLVHAATGTLVAAAVGFAIGARLGHGPLVGLLGPRVNALRREVVRRGVLAVATIRILPLAPFVLVNLLAGAGGVRFADFIGGTVLGLAPGIIAMSAFGDQLLAVIRDPTPCGIAAAAGLLAVWVAVAFALQRLVGRRGGHESRGAS
ncbi:TVP38/TMEM64 family protein [Rhodoplanes azumiensis]|uniref:TVP38/TMEM64 family membrane protein n=1 Tax=Rhodoplanes azumiensis TaxID=1897628 RepID=A0ABW5ARL3_9BRAD